MPAVSGSSPSHTGRVWTWSPRQVRGKTEPTPAGEDNPDHVTLVRRALTRRRSPWLVVADCDNIEQALQPADEHPARRDRGRSEPRIPIRSRSDQRTHRGTARHHGLALSAEPADRTRAEVLALGAFGYIEKPPAVHRWRAGRPAQPPVRHVSACHRRRREQRDPHVRGRTFSRVAPDANRGPRFGERGTTRARRERRRASPPSAAPAPPPRAGNISRPSVAHTLTQAVAGNEPNVAATPGKVAPAPPPQ